jgi:hypothetical protein
MLCGVNATRSPGIEGGVSCGCAMSPMGTPDRLLFLNAVVVITDISSGNFVMHVARHAALRYSSNCLLS